ncbi:MAG: RNA polymerase sigma-70 factor [Bacteroidales bacterium]|nr:RNA polymerase sigma-70 factor [Bacteroidales bacterium]
MKKQPDILAKEICKGDLESYELFFRLEFDNIVYFVNGYLHDPDLAKDIAQESLLTLWEKRGIIDPEKNLRAFLYTIAKNRAINELKTRSSSVNSISINEIKANLNALMDDSLGEELETLELKQLIDSTIRNLPDTVRGSFIMSRKLGMTNKEIANAKNMSLTGVEYHMKISLNILRKKLKEFLIFFQGWMLFFLYNS